HLFDFALGNADKGCRGVEDLPQYVGGQAFQRQQMVQFAVLVELRVRWVKPHGGQSRISCRASRPWASRVSSLFPPEGTMIDAPVNSAAIGSSRPPRSTRAARRMFAGRP